MSNPVGSMMDNLVPRDSSCEFVLTCSPLYDCWDFSGFMERLSRVLSKRACLVGKYVAASLKEDQIQNFIRQ